MTTLESFAARMGFTNDLHDKVAGFATVTAATIQAKAALDALGELHRGAAPAQPTKVEEFRSRATALAATLEHAGNKVAADHVRNAIRDELLRQTKLLHEQRARDQKLLAERARLAAKHAELRKQEERRAAEESARQRRIAEEHLARTRLEREQAEEEARLAEAQRQRQQIEIERLRQQVDPWRSSPRPSQPSSPPLSRQAPPAPAPSPTRRADSVRQPEPRTDRFRLIEMD